MISIATTEMNPAGLMGSDREFVVAGVRGFLGFPLVETAGFAGVSRRQRGASLVRTIRGGRSGKTVKATFKKANSVSWLPDMDLNHDKQIQSLLCYRYTIGQSIGRLR